MAKTKANLDGVQAKGTAAVLNKPGAVDLKEYPRLVYAPTQHGAGIRTEDNGTPVRAIADAVAAGSSADDVAAKFGTTAEHVADAVRYASAAGYQADG